LQLNSRRGGTSLIPLGPSMGSTSPSSAPITPAALTGTIKAASANPRSRSVTRGIGKCVSHMTLDGLFSMINIFSVRTLYMLK
ncbi:hypothetical protein IscW_ISCW014853, partial [Ixodes scapularis]